MSKKGENIYKRKDGRWEGRYIRFYDQDQKAKYGYVYAKTYKEAKTKLIERISNKPSTVDLSASNNPDYNTILDAWLQSTRKKVKESTYARYSYIVNSHIRPQLGSFSISKISTQLVEGFIDQKLKSGNIRNNCGLSPKTVTDILTIIKSTMEYARYNNMYVICNLSKLTIKKKDKEMRVLSKLEQDALVRVLLNETDYYKFGVLLSLYTGIRIGELCALQWEDVDLCTSTLRVRKTVQRIQETNLSATSKTKLIITEPKSSSSIRDVPLPVFITDIAKRFITQPKSYILSGERGRCVEPRTMQNKFKKYLKESRIENANYHCLRHTFATRCVEVGFEIKSLSEVLGHSNVNITLNRYVHSSFELKFDNINRLSLPI